MQTQPDAVLSALIAKLPATGTVWPAAKRLAWLRMVHMAFDLVYETEPGEVLELPAFLGEPASPAPAETAAAPAAPERITSKPAPYAFWIDPQGVARKASGDRLMPGEVSGVLYDLRGELGDLGAILWADGSTGVSGYQLEISAA